MKRFAKKMLRVVLWFAYRASDPWLRYQSVAVLCYHSVAGGAHETAINVEQLKAQLDALKRRGYAFVALDDIVAYAKGERSLPRRAVSLTFDDGYTDFLTVALPLLRERGIPAAVFVMREPREAWDAPLMGLAQAMALNDPLVTIGWHTDTHPNLADIAFESVTREIKAPFVARYFAYPGGNHPAPAVEAVRAAGYEAAFAIRPVLVHPGRDPYLLPRSVITRDMRPFDVLFQASPAADWYRALV